MKYTVASGVVAGLFMAGSVLAADMPPLAKELNCAACHAIDRRVAGPAWQAIAAKYQGAAKFEYDGRQYPLLEGLVLKVSRGGAGHWGAEPMPANDPSGSKKGQIEQLVRFILGLAK